MAGGGGASGGDDAFAGGGGAPDAVAAFAGAAFASPGRIARRGFAEMTSATRPPPTTNSAMMSLWRFTMVSYRPSFRRVPR